MFKHDDNTDSRAIMETSKEQPEVNYFEPDTFEVSTAELVQEAINNILMRGSLQQRSVHYFRELLTRDAIPDSGVFLLYS